PRPRGGPALLLEPVDQFSELNVATAANADDTESLRGLRLSANGFKFPAMDESQAAAIHQALVAVQHAVTSMTFPVYDQEELIEAIDSVEAQLHTNHPNVALMCRFLNSIARSLRAQPEARDACLAIEHAIGKAG